MGTLDASRRVGRLSWSEMRPFGVEVDFDLRQALQPEEQECLRSLLWQKEIVVFHGQHIPHSRQVEIMGIFGPPVSSGLEGAIQLSTDRDKGEGGTRALPFHSDYAFLPHPRPANALYGLDLIDGASATRFASATRPLARLPPALRKRISGLSAVSCWTAGEYVPVDSTRPLANWVPRTSHPMIMAHPISGRAVVYATEMQTAFIEGLPAEESQALLKEVLSYIYAPDNIYEHAWHIGDWVIWDNIATQHARGDLKSVGLRTMQKVQLGSTFEEQWPAIKTSRELQASLASMRNMASADSWKAPSLGR